MNSLSEVTVTTHTWRVLLACARALKQHLETWRFSEVKVMSVNIKNTFLISCNSRKVTSWSWANRYLPSILRSPKVHYRIHKSSRIVTILIQINAVNTRNSIFPFFVILSTHLRLGLPSGRKVPNEALIDALNATEWRGTSEQISYTRITLQAHRITEDPGLCRTWGLQVNFPTWHKRKYWISLLHHPNWKDYDAKPCP
jgi:hypothetical protein